MCRSLSCVIQRCSPVIFAPYLLPRSNAACTSDSTRCALLASLMPPAASGVQLPLGPLRTPGLSSCHSVVALPCSRQTSAQMVPVSETSRLIRRTPARPSVAPISTPNLVLAQFNSRACRPSIVEYYCNTCFVQGLAHTTSAPSPSAPT